MFDGEKESERDDKYVKFSGMGYKHKRFCTHRIELLMFLVVFPPSGFSFGLENISGGIWT